jgi:hypothetical protein
MIKCCENCKFAMYDSAPYGMGSASYISGCAKEDDLPEDFDDTKCEFWQEDRRD